MDERMEERMDGWVDWIALTSRTKGRQVGRKKERKLRMEERTGKRINEINEAE
jgi:hypothetical protein